jgi:hypothetical protein
MRSCKLNGLRTRHTDTPFRALVMSARTANPIAAWEVVRNSFADMRPSSIFTSAAMIGNDGQLVDVGAAKPYPIL